MPPTSCIAGAEPSRVRTPARSTEGFVRSVSQTGPVHKSLPFPGEPASQLTLVPGPSALSRAPRAPAWRLPDSLSLSALTQLSPTPSSPPWELECLQKRENKHSQNISSQVCTLLKNRNVAELRRLINFGAQRSLDQGGPALKCCQR